MGVYFSSAKKILPHFLKLFGKATYKQKRVFALISLLIPALGILAIVLVYPVIWSFYLSFRDYNFLQGTLVNRFVGFRNYVSIFTKPSPIAIVSFARVIYQTFTYAAGITAVSFLLAFGFALLTTKVSRGARAFQTIITIPMMMIPAATILIWRAFLYNQTFGWINIVLDALGLEKQLFLGSTEWSLYAVMMVDIWQWTPFLFLFLLAGLRALPPALFEAAAIDGASSWQKFIHLTLPLLRPIILIILCLKFIDTFRAFDYVYLLTGGGPVGSSEILSTYIYRLAFGNTLFGQGASMSVLMFLLLLPITVLFVRLIFRRG